MSFQKFIPELEAKNIEHALREKAILASDCNMAYEGTVKKGGKIKILGVGQPTFGQYTGEDIGAPESLKAFSETIEITEAPYFNYSIDDIDKAYNHKGLMDAYSEETTEGMAAERDKFIGRKCYEAVNDKTISVYEKVVKSYADLAAVISKAKVALRKNCVSPDIEITGYFESEAYDQMGDFIINKGTENRDVIASGEIKNFKGCKIKETNCIYFDGEWYYAILKTKRAFAFAGVLDEVEAYRPQGKFEDAVKGLDVFGGGVVRPKEIAVIKYKLQLA